MALAAILIRQDSGMPKRPFRASVDERRKQSTYWRSPTKKVTLFQRIFRKLSSCLRRARKRAMRPHSHYTATESLLGVTPLKL